MVATCWVCIVDMCSTLGPKDLEDVLNSVRRTNRKLNKLSVMFNKTQAKGVGRFLASDRNVREVSASRCGGEMHKMFSHGWYSLPARRAYA